MKKRHPRLSFQGEGERKEERGGEPEPERKRERSPKLVPSEQTVMEDGQLGDGNLERGPERVNPEGSSALPNPPPDER